MRILLAIDDSPSSDAAIAEVGRRPWPAQTIVQIVTAEPLVESSLRMGSPGVFDEIIKETRAKTAARLNDAVRAIQQASPGLRVLSKLLEGSAKEVIVTEAERWEADLVVVGSHGYGAIRRFLLGSVSLSVALHAPCSVLIVRSRSTDPQANV